MHEWIEHQGGAEKVLDAFMEAFPDADLLALWDDTGGHRYAGRQVQETWLARTPLRRSKALALPAMPPTWRSRLNGDYEWMLVSSHLFAHHASLRGARDVPKVVYAHTPARYIWAPEHDDRGRTVAARLASPALRALDRRRASEIQLAIANSGFVRDRIGRTWEIPATVVHPPVNVREIAAVAHWVDRLEASDLEIIDGLGNGFVLGASRWVEYKRLDLVIRAADEAGLPAVIAGGGPDEPRLRALAAQVSVPVTFVPNPSAPLLYALYQRAAVFVFPPIEDFGIMPVEAMAAGAAVVVGPEGGAREGIEIANGGIVAESADPRDLARAIDDASRLDLSGVPDALQALDRATFIARIAEIMDGIA